MSPTRVRSVPNNGGVDVSHNAEPVNPEDYGRIWTSRPLLVGVSYQNS
jgi:hypothetical protein